MHTKGPVMCPEKDIGTSRQIIKRKKWANGKEGSGPTGWKLRPSKVLAQAIAKLAVKRKAK